MNGPADSRPRPTRSWLHEGTEKTKAKLARVRELKAKEDLVVEAAVAWWEAIVAARPDDGETDAIDLLDAVEALVKARGRK
jgi:hypothetical protein